MFRFFKSRRPGPTDLTWKEKMDSDYTYHPKEGVRSVKDSKGIHDDNPCFFLLW